MIDIACETCAYWAAQEGDDAGECRRHSPRPRPTEEAAHWPITEPDDWCGEWEDGEPMCGCDEDEACPICEPDAEPAAIDEAFQAIVANLTRRRWWHRKGTAK